VGEDQFAAGEAVALLCQGLEVEVAADRSGAVALAEEQIDTVGGLQECVRPLGVT
jgi:hypothetical protein